MSCIRDRVAERIRTRRDLWVNIVAVEYALILKDRIGDYGIDKRNGIPGIWGHSYVRTYYDWIKSIPSEKTKLEGGIATTYYVVKALNKYYSRLSISPKREFISDLLTFLERRTTSAGIGVESITARGGQQIEVNLRHTNYGYLTMSEIALNSPWISSRLEPLMEKTVNIIMNSLAPETLVGLIIDETWPVGGVASYVSARDQILLNSSKSVFPHERSIWNHVRNRLLLSLSELTSLKVHSLFEQYVHDSKPNFETAFLEHYPFWHPILGCPTLRLHSTLGCLESVGKDISLLQEGKNRINQIINTLKHLVFQEYGQAPRFSKESPPSIAAAISIAAIILGDWYEPEEYDWKLLDIALSYIEHNWLNADAYKDYWSEFTAQLLAMDEVLSGIQDCVHESYEIGECVAREIDSIGSNNLLSSREKMLVNVARGLLPIAVGIE